MVDRAAVLCAVVLLLLTGCSSNIKQGKWDGTIYYNTWSDMAFDLSATDFVQDTDTLKVMRAANKGQSGDGAVTTDFCLSSNSGDVDIMLQYVIDKVESSQPEKDYVTSISEGLLEDPANKLLDTQTMEIGGYNYLVQLVVQNKTLVKAVLVRKVDGGLIVWTVDANSDTAQSTAQSFFSGIKSLKQ